MDEFVTVLMPIGPNFNIEWVKEAVESVFKQTYPVDELFIVDDLARINYRFLSDLGFDGYAQNNFHEHWYVSNDNPFPSKNVRIWRSPAHIGFTAAFNIGMGFASNDLVMYLASDDRLMPTAIEKAVAAWENNAYKDAWYHLKYVDSDGNVAHIQNNIALTTKYFFLEMCGGYPPAAFVGPDAALLSCLMVHAPDRIIPVKSEEPLYWIRNHDQQETKTHTWKYVPEMNSIRGKLTAEFRFKND